MGISYWAFGILGHKLRRDQVRETVSIRRCECDVKGNPKFCPECGKPLMTEEEQFLSFVKEVNYEDRIGPYSLCTTYGYDDCDYILSIKTVKACVDGYRDDVDHAMMTIGDIPSQKAVMKNALEPLGLWDESQFGFWVVTDAG